MSEFTDSQGQMACTPRIRQLALTSGRSPAEMLRFVMRDGLHTVELSINENARADAEFAAGATAGHADVMRDALKVIFPSIGSTKNTQYDIIFSCQLSLQKSHCTG